MKKFNVLSLFNGISCGRLALDRAIIPVRNYISYEIDKYANMISQHHYPDDIYYGDVLSTNFKEVDMKIDLLLGGSPCTYWSIAHPSNTRETDHNGLGFELFMGYVKALKRKKPTYFLYENNFSIHQNIKDKITDQLGVNPLCFNSNIVSAQNRTRLYWTNIKMKNLLHDRNIFFKDIYDRSLPFRPMTKYLLGYRGDRSRRQRMALFSDLKAPCLTTKRDHTEVLFLSEDQKTFRPLSEIEYEILQTLPINYTLVPGVAMTHRYKGIGNGWTVDIVAHILRQIHYQ